MSAPTLTAQLDELRDTYIYSVNAAIEDGREQLAHQLAARYPDEAIALMSTAAVAPATPTSGNHRRQGAP